MKQRIHLLTLLFLLISLAMTTAVRVDLAALSRTQTASARPAAVQGEAPPEQTPAAATPAPTVLSEVSDKAQPLPSAEPSPSPISSNLPAQAPPAASSSAPAPVPTLVPTPEPTPEPEPEFFTISAVGDCTLWSHPKLAASNPASYASMVGEDYAYPFQNTFPYFESDELTLANLECTLSDAQLYSSSQFYFRAPSAYARILTEGGVDFVNTANNHTLDFGQQGVTDTLAALDAVSMPHGVEGQAQVITTPNDIKIGIYCDYHGYYPRTEDCVAAIQQMKEEGAEYIICMFHWGQDEVVYHPKQVQIDLAHACVDAGADFIYGSHSHCLQPYEEYNGAYILYSIGNWSFGGNTSPKDMDTAIFQITIKRDLDGSISNESCGIIPCCVSSRPVLEGYTGYGYNDYCPTPYEPGTELYDRAMSKILGTYEGPDGVVDYSNWRNS